MRPIFTVVLTAVAIVGCGSPAPKTTGSVQFRFAVSDGVRSNPSLKDPLVGTAYGDIFLAEDVGITGPRSTTAAVASIPATSADLRTVMASESDVIIDGLAPGQYTFLGYLDVDNNPGTPSHPDSGDPAALPRTNLFDIKAGEQTKRLIVFDLLYN